MKHHEVQEACLAILGCAFKLLLACVEEHALECHGPILSRCRWEFWQVLLNTGCCLCKLFFRPWTWNTVDSQPLRLVHLHQTNTYWKKQCPKNAEAGHSQFFSRALSEVCITSTMCRFCRHEPVMLMEQCATIKHTQDWAMCSCIPWTATRTGLRTFRQTSAAQLHSQIPMKLCRAAPLRSLLGPAAEPAAGRISLASVCSGRLSQPSKPMQCKGQKSSERILTQACFTP